MGPGPSTHCSHISSRGGNVDYVVSSCGRRKAVARPKVVITGGAGFIGSHVADALGGEAGVGAVCHLKSGESEKPAKGPKGRAALVRRDLVRGDPQASFPAVY